MTKPEYDVRISLDERPTYFHEVVAESRRFIKQLRIRAFLGGNSEAVTKELIDGSAMNLDVLLNPLRRAFSDLSSSQFSITFSGVVGVEDRKTLVVLWRTLFDHFYTIIDVMRLHDLVGVTERRDFTFNVPKDMAPISREIDRLEDTTDFIATLLPSLEKSDRHSQTIPPTPHDPYETRLIVNLDEPDVNEQKGSFVFDGAKYSAPIAVCVWLEGLRKERGTQIGLGEIRKGFSQKLAIELDGVEAGDLWKKLPKELKPFVLNGPTKNKGYSLQLRQNP